MSGWHTEIEPLLGVMREASFHPIPCRWVPTSLHFQGTLEVLLPQDLCTWSSLFGTQLFLGLFPLFFFLNLHPHWECLKSAGTCVHTNALVKFSIWILPYETLELLFNVPHSPFRRQTPGRHAALGGFVYFILLQSLLALQLRSHVIENKRKKRVDCLKLQYWGCSSCLEIRMGNRKCIPLFFWISARVIFS